MQVFMCYSLIW